ncbi:uncharacterized protein LOC107266189 [Cephus cinctus]|uniref:Uncharacterized protein LOC107266189 n=1 Tax=Cephus cinctus TaxID=211228 RepID=A0AAJ7BQH8_CEPCN|nr:uncharacterized protein LOC107266189 [Cephus cinctus]
MIGRTGSFLLLVIVAVISGVTGNVLNDPYQRLPARENSWPSFQISKTLLAARHSRDSLPSARLDRMIKAHPQDRTRLHVEKDVNHSYRNAQSSSFEKGFEQPSRTDRLTAVARSEGAGTRAVAYAGYHSNHHQHHHQGRESYLQGFQNASPVQVYTKQHPGRRVCTRQAPSAVAQHHRGRQIRVLYTEVSSGFLCCPGWTQVTRFSFGCNKPTCSLPCLNGGTCTSPGRCTCPKGFTGNQCETDVDECVTEKPCGQLCRNVLGSYECNCRPGFQLQPDGQSCRKSDGNGTAFEARDLENDYGPTTTKKPSIQDSENEVGDSDLDQDYEIILKRLIKLEKQLAREKKRDTKNTEMNTKMDMTVERMRKMSRTVDNMLVMKQEMNDMKNQMKLFEQESRKIQQLANRIAELENRLIVRCSPALPINGRMNY